MYHQVSTFCPQNTCLYFIWISGKKWQPFTSLALTGQCDVFSVRYRPNIYVQFRLILRFRWLGGGYSVNNFDATWNGPNTRGGRFYKPHVEVLLADILVRSIYQHTFYVIFITEVSAGIYQTCWQRAVPARSDAATSTRIFWPLTARPEDDVHFKDKRIWREPDVCNDLDVWR